MVSVPHLFTALACSALFSSSYIISKLVSVCASPMCLVFLRFVFLIMAIVPLLDFSVVKKIGLREILLFIAAGLTGICLYGYIFFQAILRTSATNVALVAATTPTITLLVASVCFKKMPTLKHLAAYALAFSGVACIITKGDLSPDMFQATLGEQYMFLAVLSWSLYSVIIRALSEKIPSRFIVFAASVTGLVFLFPLSVQAGLFSSLYTITLLEWVGIAYLGAGASMIGMSLYAESIKNLGAGKAALIVFSTVPIFTALFSFILWGTTIDLWQVSGALLVIGALSLIR